MTSLATQVRTAQLLAGFTARLALTLRHHGVDEFATRNINDFNDFGFSHGWDPVTSDR